MIRLTKILQEENERRDAAMVSGVADIVSKVKDDENRKEIAQQMMSKFDLEDVNYDKDSFLKLSKVSEAFYKGQLFAGNLKIDGAKVPVEVELLGADNKKKTFIAKVIHIDKKYYSKLPKDGILNIPAQIFRMTGGWRKIKTPSVFESGYPEDINFKEFAQKRLEGATKISNDAKEKGGAAILTYHHFVVKLPYYKKATEGGFNLAEAQTELKQHLDELCGVGADMEQIRFQELVGLVEVLGELIIKSK